MVPEVIFDENVVSGRFPAFCHTLGEVCSAAKDLLDKMFILSRGDTELQAPLHTLCAFTY